MVRVAARVPPELLRRGRVLRPVDAEDVYSNPRPEFARLERAGALHRLAPGLFVAVPDDRLGKGWRPSLEAVALGVAGTGGHGAESALMGISAARVHGAIPRALNVAVVAVQRHRRTLQLVDRRASVLFVRRDVARLDLQRHRTELGQGWVTTVEQTVLDLLGRPDLGGIPDAAGEAAAALIARADVALLEELATQQRRRRVVDVALAARREA
ncbi:type IV toxin-antitoxin system AbiEi family antitoxin [Pseudonocardia halophobica]|nr:type IV toxin-antitoxin system AbiEi family antitoxin [Pseudonocardia halophobica]